MYMVTRTFRASNELVASAKELTDRIYEGYVDWLSKRKNWTWNAKEFRAVCDEVDREMREQGDILFVRVNKVTTADEVIMQIVMLYPTEQVYLERNNRQNVDVTSGEDEPDLRPFGIRMKIERDTV